MSVSLMASLVSNSHAADGTWNTVTDNSLWGTPANWVGGTGADVADGAASTAFFNNVNPAAATTVRLDSSRTIGTLVFGDTDTATAGRWILDNNGVAGNILTLGGAATITVNTMASGAASTAPNVTISAVIDGVNGLTKNGTGTNGAGSTTNVNGTGTLTLSGANTYTGATNINAGTLRVTNAAGFGGVAGDKINTNVVNVADGARLVVSASIANTVNLNGSSALAIAGSSGTLSGIVNLESNSSAWVTNVGGNVTLTFSDTGALNLGSNVFTISTGGTSNGATIAGTLTGGASSGITKNGGGPLTMSGDGSGYSGTTTLSSGELRVGSANALGSGTLALNVSNDSLVTIRSTDTTDRSIATAVTLTGANSNSRFLFGSTNTSFNGGLTFANTTEIALAATRKIDVYNVTRFDAAFTGAGGINLNAANTGSPTITQAGGTLVLNGVNTYAGATTINAGTLLITGSKTGAGAVTVNSTGTLGGTGTIAGASTAAAGAFLSAGASSGAVGTLTFSGTLDISGLAGGTGGLLFNLAGAGASDKIVSGALTIGTGVLDLNDFSFTTLGGYGAGTYTLLDATSIVGTLGSSLTGTVGGLDAVLSISGNDLVLTVTAIPEPSAYAMIAGSALLGFKMLRRRRDRV